MEQHSNGNTNGLHITIISLTFHLSLSGLDIVNNGLFEDGDFKVIALSISLWGESCDFIKFDGIMSNVNY